MSATMEVKDELLNITETVVSAVTLPVTTDQPASSMAGECRCCGTSVDRNSKELTVEYSYLGVREVYADMLQECFNIHLSQPKKKEHCYACEACVGRLRDATSFKRQVFSAEQRFLDRFQTNKTDKKDVIAVKMELLPIEDDDESAWTDDLMDFDDYEDSLPLKMEKIKKEPEPSSSGVFKPVGKKVEQMLKSKNTAKPKSKESFKMPTKPLGVTFKKTLKLNPPKMLSNPLRKSLGAGRPVVDPLTRSVSSSKENLLKKIGHEKAKLILKSKEPPRAPTITLKPTKTLLISRNSIGSSKNSLNSAIAPVKLNGPSLPKPNDGKSPFTVKGLSSLLKVMMQKKSKVTVSLTAGEKLRKATMVRRDIEKTFEADKRTERQVIKQNVVNVLRNATALPFTYYRGNFKCYYCSENFFEFEKLRSHMGQVHSDVKKETRKIYAFKDIIYVEITSLKCRLCQKGYEDLDAIKEHLAKEHKIRIDTKHKDDMVPFKLSSNQFKCHICDEEFHVFRNLSLHISTHFANYMCEVCGKPFISAKRCQTHENTHKTGHYPCLKCDKVFTSLNSRSSHAMEHRDTKYRCPQCPEKFDKYLDRTVHMSQVHNFTQKFVCPHPQCNREFIHKPQLNAHVRNHSVKEKKVECTECGMRFYNNYALDRHMVSHTGERAYQCKVCGKKYGRANTLREHMRIHENDRRHVCNVCGQGFVQKCSLKGHMKSRHPHVEWPIV